MPRDEVDTLDGQSDSPKPVALNGKDTTYEQSDSSLGALVPPRDYEDTADGYNGPTTYFPPNEADAPAGVQSGGSGQKDHPKPTVPNEVDAPHEQSVGS